jgi:hypothetical protein
MSTGGAGDTGGGSGNAGSSPSVRGGTAGTGGRGRRGGRRTGKDVTAPVKQSRSPRRTADFPDPGSNRSRRDDTDIRP